MDNICKYCGKSTPLCAAHIIPKCILKGSHKSIDKQEFKEIAVRQPCVKRMPNGPYDKEILCPVCDENFGKYDQCAKELLIDHIQKYKHKSLDLYEIPPEEINYESLKKFFISMIWRASISQQNIFKGVVLGPYDEIAKKMLKDEKSLDDMIFSVLLFKDGKNVQYRDTISLCPTELAGKKAYKIHFSGYQLTIVPKAKDMQWKAQTGTALPSDLFLRKGRPFVIIEINEDLSGKEELLKLYKKSRIEQGVS